MNNARRKLIAEIVEKLEPFKDYISDVLAEEQDAFDNMPEGLQQSARGEAAQSAIGSMEQAVDYIDSCLEELSSAQEAA